MSAADRESLRDALTELRDRAVAARRSAGQRSSSRAAAEHVRRQFGVELGKGGQRISAWTNTDSNQQQVPQDFGAMWALVQVWSTWVGEKADRRRWVALFDAAQPDPPCPKESSQDDDGPVGRLIAALDDVDTPLQLEVHRAIDAPGSWAPLPVLPTYVERDHDRRLRVVVEAAAAGVSGMVVLVGGALTGKTRACWEAIRLLGEVPGGWRVWHPVDPLPSEAFLEELPRVGPCTVVWLDEAQRYLDTTGSDLGERVAGRLRGLLQDPRRTPVLVVGTIWLEHVDVLTKTPASGANDLHAAARVLLDGRTIKVPEAFADAELEAVRTASADDPRLAYALEHADDGEITQYLAGGPAQVARYESASPGARALIEAAMDARRLGYGLALPAPLLEAAAPGYLTGREWDRLGDDWFEQALACAADPCKGADGPLTRIRPRPGQPSGGPTLYRLADYLEQHARRTRRAQRVPAEFWQACLAHAGPADQVVLGRAAENRGLLRVAFLHYASATLASESDAPRSAALLLREAGRVQEAFAWYRQAGVFDPDALRAAASMLHESGRTDEAIRCLRDQAEAGETDAMFALAGMYVEIGRTEEALNWYREAGEAGEPAGFRFAAQLLERTGQSQHVFPSYLRAAEAGDTLALGQVAARALRTGLRREEPEPWTSDMLACLWDLAATGDYIALLEVTQGLEEVGRAEEAFTGALRVAETGLSMAVRVAVGVLVRAGRGEEALDWLRARAVAGDGDDLLLTADLLQALGRTGEALIWYQRAVEASVPGATRETVSFLQESGQLAEALTWLWGRAEAGDLHALDVAVEMLWAEPLPASSRAQIEQVMEWLSERAQTGEAVVMARLGDLCRLLGRFEEALTWYRQAAAAGAPGWRPAAATLDQAGRAAEAEQLRRYGWEPNGAIADPWDASVPGHNR